MASRECERAAGADGDWRRWGTFLPERQWGTVREDYSANGNAWAYFPHEHARSRAYRWGEDGIFGWTDRQCRLCFAPVFWNHRDPILKERLFGLAGPEGSHGEDVKESYHYLDATPTHTWASAVYRYPQAEFPYARLTAENRGRARGEKEFELEDTGIFDDGRFFEIEIEYARRGTNDVLIRVRAHNAGPDPAPLDMLAQLWFRNTWSWPARYEDAGEKPRLWQSGTSVISSVHPTLGAFELQASETPGQWLFTENETNTERLFGEPNRQPYVKDAFHRLIVGGESNAVNPLKSGTKSAGHYRVVMEGGGTREWVFRLCPKGSEPFNVEQSREVFEKAQAEAGLFYAGILPEGLSDERRRIARQAYAGLIWTKQFYHYVVNDWIQGDADQPAPPPGRGKIRNGEWRHFHAREILSMPDKWEYPWFAAWDLAFHMIPFARIDPRFAKDQLTVLLREWYMHPNGQLPAYEWEFGDVNPPVHAWAVWRVYKISAARGERDRAFLEGAFQKLLLNFTWWVNRKDSEGHNLFSGGFLGLDNIGVFDRSRPLPGGGTLKQADGTAWMGFYCLTMLGIALELAPENSAYEDMASKFFEHFIAIADAINGFGGSGLWDEDDGFFYDRYMVGGQSHVLRTRSLVGLIPLLAVEFLDDRLVERLPGFRDRKDWFVKNRPDLAAWITWCDHCDVRKHSLLALVKRERLIRILRRMLDEREFLSPFGIRSMSAAHATEPFVFDVDGVRHCVAYSPGEAPSGMFGGNSNWRGPVWFPLNYLLIEALERFHHFYGDDLKVECPTGSGQWMNLADVAGFIARRLVALFESNASGIRPFEGSSPRPRTPDLVQFHEYFHGDDGRGLGASHQTGWTALVVRFIEDVRCR
ncbi:MAG: hypothetical protein SFU53_09320 [Terrimicrobiaceae bacterium]|nr:hypothetical protein [Terrimicrobiaceae bacterium]